MLLDFAKFLLFGDVGQTPEEYPEARFDLSCHGTMFSVPMGSMSNLALQRHTLEKDPKGIPE
jgi:hypothetical protein